MHKALSFYQRRMHRLATPPLLLCYARRLQQRVMTPCAQPWDGISIYRNQSSPCVYVLIRKTIRAVKTARPPKASAASFPACTPTSAFESVRATSILALFCQIRTGICPAGRTSNFLK